MVSRRPLGLASYPLVCWRLRSFARYGRRLTGAWRWIYVSNCHAALYLNVFVLIVQLFRKVPALRALAPTESEPPFLVPGMPSLSRFLFVLTILP